MKTLIEPYGGKLRILYLANDALEMERRRAIEYPSWHLTDRQTCDVELLMNGAFSPLTGFMTREEYERVVRDCRPWQWGDMDDPDCPRCRSGVR